MRALREAGDGRGKLCQTIIRACALSVVSTSGAQLHFNSTRTEISTSKLKKLRNKNCSEEDAAVTGLEKFQNRNGRGEKLWTKDIVECQHGKCEIDFTQRQQDLE